VRPTFRGFMPGQDRPWLFVVQSTDMANGKHQLKISMPRFPAVNEVHAVMTHSLGESFGERVVLFKNRLSEIWKAVKHT